MTQDAPRSIGGYLIDGELGRGGMGAVYKAHHPMLPGRELALKVLLDARTTDPDTLARFQREMQALAKIPEHANVVRIFTGSTGVEPFFVMEYVDGPTLHRRVASGPLEPREAARILLEVAHGVAHMHSHGVIHRDLKPHNVFLAADGRVVVGDFGLAKVAGEQRLTQTQSSFGTPGYSAPEQLDGRAARAEKRADVFALGATLWYTLTGRAPFVGATPVNVVMQTLSQAAEPPSRHRAGVPAELDAICLHALEKVPIARYPSAEAFAADLERYLRGQPVDALEATRRRARARRRRWLWLVGLALVAVFAGLGVRWGLAQRERANRIEAPLAAALEAKSDAPALAAKRAALEAAGANDEELSRLLRHILDVARAEAMAPAATSDSVRTRIRLLQELGRDTSVVAGLKAPLARALARELDVSLASPKPDPQVAVALAASLPDVRAEVDLVGEAPALGLPVGSLLVDAALRLETVAAAGSSSPCVAAAAELARQRLEARPTDAAALALRAYVTLARDGAPVRPLGPGRPGTRAARDPVVRSDLEAASKLAGEPGERAAWLLVDLCLQAENASAGSIEPALQAGVALHEHEHKASFAVRAALRELARLEPNATSLGILLAPERWKDEPGLAALVLARFLSRCGAPSAIDRPELATGGGSPRSEARREDLSAYTPPCFPKVNAPDPDPRTLPQELITAAYDSAGKVPESADGADGDAVHAALRASFRENAASLDAGLAAALRACPDDGGTLLAASCQHRLRFSSATLKILEDRTVVDDTSSLEDMFSPGDRGLLLENKGSTTFYELAWELDGRHGLAAVGEFRRLVERDTTGGGDPAVTALLESAASRRDVLLANDAAVGLRALEELSFWDDLPAHSDERAPLALIAAHGLESYARLGGPAVLAFRARWRRLVIPGDAGARLAALDLARMARAIGETASRRDVESWDNPPLAGAPALVGAFEAAETQGAEDLARDLFRLALAVRAERALILQRRATTSSPGERAEAVLKYALVDSKEKIGFSARAQGLRRLLGWNVDMSPELAKVFEPPVDLLSRLEAKTYEPRTHWPTGASGASR